MIKPDVISDIEKVGHLLTGKERARLICKDAHEKAFVNKKGFLTEREIAELVRMPDYKISDEYKRYRTMYKKVGFVMGALTESYLRFKCEYEQFKKNYVKLIHFVSMEYIASLTQDEQVKKEAHRIKNTFYTIDKLKTLQSCDKKMLYSNYLDHTASNLWAQTSYFYAMKRVVEWINEGLDFNVFSGKTYDEVFEDYKKDVELSIKEYNKSVAELTKPPLSNLFIDEYDIQELKTIEDHKLVKPYPSDRETYKGWKKELLSGD